MCLFTSNWLFSVESGDTGGTRRVACRCASKVINFSLRRWREVERIVRETHCSVSIHTHIHGKHTRKFIYNGFTWFICAQNNKQMPYTINIYAHSVFIATCVGWMCVISLFNLTSLHLESWTSVKTQATISTCAHTSRVSINTIAQSLLYSLEQSFQSGCFHAKLKFYSDWGMQSA